MQTFEKILPESSLPCSPRSRASFVLHSSVSFRTVEKSERKISFYCLKAEGLARKTFLPHFRLLARGNVASGVSRTSAKLKPFSLRLLNESAEIWVCVCLQGPGCCALEGREKVHGGRLERLSRWKFDALRPEQHLEKLQRKTEFRSSGSFWPVQQWWPEMPQGKDVWDDLKSDVRLTGELASLWPSVFKSTWWRSCSFKYFFKPPNKATSTEKISLNSHLALATSTSLHEHVWAYRGRRNYKPFCVRLLLFALKTFCSAFAFLLIQQNLISLRAVGAFCAKSFRSKLTHRRRN